MASGASDECVSRDTVKVQEVFPAPIGAARTWGPESWSSYRAARRGAELLTPAGSVRDCGGRQVEQHSRVVHSIPGASAREESEWTWSPARRSATRPLTRS